MIVDIAGECGFVAVFVGSPAIVLTLCRYIVQVLYTKKLGIFN